MAFVIMDVMMPGRKRALIILAIIAGFVSMSMGIEIYRQFNPSIPSKWLDDPYNISLEELDAHPEFVEGERIHIVAEPVGLVYHEINDTLEFHVKDEIPVLDFLVRFENWTTKSSYTMKELEEASSFVIIGTSRIISSNYIAGVQIHVIKSENVYLVSILPLAILIVAILYYFKINLKKLTLVGKNRHTKHVEEGIHA